MKEFLHIVKKHLVVVGSLVVILVCGGLHILHLGKAETLKAEYDRLVKKRSSILLNLKNGATFAQDIQELNKILENIDSRLFDSKELAANYNYFFQIEAQTGVKLSNLQQFNPSTAATNKKGDNKNKNYSSLRYELGVTGTFSQIMNFLRHVEGGLSLFRIDRISITQGKVIDEATDSLQAKMSFSILSKKES